MGEIVLENRQRHPDEAERITRDFLRVDTQIHDIE